MDVRVLIFRETGNSDDEVVGIVTFDERGKILDHLNRGDAAYGAAWERTAPRCPMVAHQRTADSLDPSQVVDRLLSDTDTRVELLRDIVAWDRWRRTLPVDDWDEGDEPVVVYI